MTLQNLLSNNKLLKQLMMLMLFLGNVNPLQTIHYILFKIWLINLELLKLLKINFLTFLPNDLLFRAKISLQSCLDFSKNEFRFIILYHKYFPKMVMLAAIPILLLLTFRYDSNLVF